ncbi:hypothetical protein B5X24_HaOG211002 [Helicoverpa armigera]|nr:hypothetical protein B5X24_HaOG211002 [Helicoverpa armigera]
MVSAHSGRGATGRDGDATLSSCNVLDITDDITQSRPARRDATRRSSTLRRVAVPSRRAAPAVCRDHK